MSEVVQFPKAPVRPVEIGSIPDSRQLLSIALDHMRPEEAAMLADFALGYVMAARQAAAKKEVFRFGLEELLDAALTTLCEEHP